MNKPSKEWVVHTVVHLLKQCRYVHFGPREKDPFVIVVFDPSDHQVARDAQGMLHYIFGDLSPSLCVTYGETRLELLVKDQKTGYGVEVKNMPFTKGSMIECLEMADNDAIYKLAMGYSDNMDTHPRLTGPEEEVIILSGGTEFVQRLAPGSLIGVSDN